MTTFFSEKEAGEKGALRRGQGRLGTLAEDREHHILAFLALRQDPLVHDIWCGPGSTGTGRPLFLASGSVSFFLVGLLKHTHLNCIVSTEEGWEERRGEGGAGGAV